MYRIIFEHHPKKGQEEDFIKQWQIGSDIIQTYPGARGTKLFRDKNKPEIIYAIVEWESKEARDKAIDKVHAECEDNGYVLHGATQYVDSHETIVEGECIAESNPPVDGELEKAKNYAEEYLNNWKRERADFLNYKKDEAKRMEEFVRFANEDLLMETIETLDDLEKAHQNFVKQNLGGQAAQEGLDQVLKKFQDLLGKYGAERIKIKGEKFDPALHEAIESEDGGDKLEEVRAGYTMHGKVIRPARVKIIK